MSHLIHNAEKLISTPSGWLKLGMEIGIIANDWADRHDLMATIGAGAGKGSPACYIAKRSEIEINTDQAFGSGIRPSMIADLTIRENQYDHPRAVGLILHEAYHARFSRWDLARAQGDLTPAEFRALNLLEESRIEAQGIRVHEWGKNFIRSAVMEIITDDLEEITGVDQALAIVGLVQGRVEAEILERSEVAQILDQVEEYLGPEVMRKLIRVIRKAQSHAEHSNALPLYDLAREWVKICKGSVDQGALEVSDLLDQIKEAGEIVSINTNDQLAQQQSTERSRQEVKNEQAMRDERKENQAIAEGIFSKSTSDADGRTSSKLVEVRKPTAEEHIASVTIAQMLEKAKYRDREVTEIHSKIPPGRLRTRSAVQSKAMRSRGLVPDVEPWRRSVRRVVDDPKLTVGVMVDISGSMGMAMNPMATTAWVMSDAVKRIQGDCAMVYFGSDVFPTLKIGQHLDEVRVFTAPDSTEEFDLAMRSLDGALNLSEGTGARLLVVVSDGHYRVDQLEKAQEWVEKLTRAGVAILWLPFDNGLKAQRIARHGDVALLSGIFDPTSVAQEIGLACARQLEMAELRR